MIVLRVTLNFDNVPGASSTDNSRSQKRKRNLYSYPGGGCELLLFFPWGNELCQSTIKPKALFLHPTRCRKNQWGECSPFHIKYSSRILALFRVLMYPIDLLGFHVPIGWQTLTSNNNSNYNTTTNNSSFITIFISKY